MASRIKAQIIGDLISGCVKQSRTGGIAAKRSKVGNDGLTRSRVRLFKTVVGGNLNADLIDGLQTQDGNERALYAITRILSRVVAVNRDVLLCGVVVEVLTAKPRIGILNVYGVLVIDDKIGAAKERPGLFEPCCSPSSDAMFDGTVTPGIV